MMKEKSLMTLLFLILLMSVFPWSADAQACTYYVSSSTGSDNADGLTDITAWRTIARVNQQSFSPGDTVCFKRGDTWRFPTDAYLIPKSGSQAGYVTYDAYGVGPKPLFLGSVEKNSPSDWTLTSTPNVWATPDNSFSLAVGNLIFNFEESTGKMECNVINLDAQGDYHYDTSGKRVLLYSTSNPADYYSDMECALHMHMVSVASKSYVKLNNLDLRYGGSHGIWGYSSNDIIISDNDLSYIGGAIQYGCTRYGNAIELWNSANNIYVEHNTIWEIFDAALTTQGSGTNTKYNHYFRNNVIWNSSYCFEYWNRPGTSSTYNIYFENNTCAYSGYGWGSAPQGRWYMGQDLAFYENTANTYNFYVRNNIFYEAANDSFMVTGSPWSGLDNLYVNYNAWYKSSGVTIYYPPCTPDLIWGGFNCTTYTFSQYRSFSGKDQNSAETDPFFVDAANNDYHPVTGSPACTLSTTGSYVGALQCVSLYDTDNDGMPDSFEIQYGLNPVNPADATYDNDNDGLTNLEEFQSGTDPANSDTEGDGLPDGSDICPLSYPVNIAGTSLYYASIQPAYDTAMNLDVILSQEEFLSGVLNFNNDISVTIRGGYDCNYVSIKGETVINGELKINKGSIKIDKGNFKIE